MKQPKQNPEHARFLKQMEKTFNNDKQPARTVPSFESNPGRNIKPPSRPQHSGPRRGR